MKSQTRMRSKTMACILLMVGGMAAFDASAQGLATWVGERLGLGDAGRAIDDANRQAKQVVPLYGQVEDSVTGAIRHFTTESMVETTAPILKNYILASRNDAMAAGAMPLPQEVVWEFSGFYAPDVLSVHWRVGQGHDLSLQANSFRYGDRAAIVLDTVVVFRSWNDANSVWLWAHELAHVEQYRAWGIDDFTKRYIRDYDAIETAANRRADEFMAFRSARLAGMSSGAGGVAGPLPQPLPPTNGSMCVTAVNACPWLGPVGWNCVCASPMGLQPGVIR